MIDLSAGACAGLADATFAESDPFYPEPVRGRPTGDPYAAARAVCAQCPISAVRSWRATNGFRTVNRRTHTPEMNQQKWDLHSAGYPDNEIAERVGCRPDSIRKWRQKNGLKVNPARGKVSA